MGTGLLLEKQASAVMCVLLCSELWLMMSFMGLLEILVFP